MVEPFGCVVMLHCRLPRLPGSSPVFNRPLPLSLSSATWPFLDDTPDTTPPHPWIGMLSFDISLLRFDQARGNCIILNEGYFFFKSFIKNRGENIRWQEFFPLFFRVFLDWFLDWFPWFLSSFKNWRVN